MNRWLPSSSSACGAIFWGALAIDTLILVELLEHFIFGGWTGVKDWIFHIETMNQIRMNAADHGTVTVKFPSDAEVWRAFLTLCIFLLVVTSGSWALRRRRR